MRVAIVTGVVVPHDAISSAAVGQAELLASCPDIESVVIFAQSIQRDLPCPGVLVGDPWALVTHTEFRRCDRTIFHWGIRYDLFDALTLLTRASPSPAVQFHNCTPPSIVPESHREVIEASIAQIHHAIGLGMPMWTFSEFNRMTLLDWGARAEQVSFVPFPVAAPRGFVPERRSSKVELLTVGRLTPAKGIDVLLDAIATLDRSTAAGVRLRLVGSTTFSDADYVASLRSRIDRGDLGSEVELIHDVDDATLWRLFGESHIVISPSFHEGLCVPLIEGYLAGCRVIGTDAGNMPFLVQEPDPIVPAGNAAALGQAIAAVVAAVQADRPRTTARIEALTSAYSVESARHHMRAELGLVPLDPAPNAVTSWPLRRTDAL